MAGAASPSVARSPAAGPAAGASGVTEPGEVEVGAFGRTVGVPVAVGLWVWVRVVSFTRLLADTKASFIN